VLVLLAYLAESVRYLTIVPLVFRRAMIYHTGMKRASIEPVSSEARPEQRVIFLVLPGVQLLDLAGPVQVFDTAMRVWQQHFGTPPSYGRQHLSL
jgi:hypothetical protein